MPISVAYQVNDDDPSITVSGGAYTGPGQINGWGSSSGGDNGAAGFQGQVRFSFISPGGTNVPVFVLPFTGTGVVVYSVVDPFSGLYEYFIDGISQGTLDTAVGARAQQVEIFRIENLTDGAHTLEVRCYRNPNSSRLDLDHYIIMDRFDVLTGTDLPIQVDIDAEAWSLPVAFADATLSEHLVGQVDPFAFPIDFADIDFELSGFERTSLDPFTFSIEFEETGHRIHWVKFVDPFEVQINFDEVDFRIAVAERLQVDGFHFPITFADANLAGAGNLLAEAWNLPISFESADYQLAQVEPLDAFDFAIQFGDSDYQLSLVDDLDAWAFPIDFADAAFGISTNERQVVGYFEPGQSVSISVYHLSTGAAVNISSSVCIERAPGVYTWNISKIDEDYEYVGWTMTNGEEFARGDFARLLIQPTEFNDLMSGLPQSTRRDFGLPESSLSPLLGILEILKQYHDNQTEFYGVDNTTPAIQPQAFHMAIFDDNGIQGGNRIKTIQFRNSSDQPTQLAQAVRYIRI